MGLSLISRQSFQLITSDRYGAFTESLADMYRLRCRVFKECLGWDVETSGDMEIDEFDALSPAYLLLRGLDSRLLGCVRFLPSSGATILFVFSVRIGLVTEKCQLMVS
jgi:acyl homoserine lactone synthase